MSTDNQYTIRPYTPADNAGLAVMWNESDDRWPGTFNGGVPMTEERVTEWMEREVSLIRLVAQSESDGAIAGYGSLWADKTRGDTCYVDLLNVSPDHQGRSLARRILTQMVDFAAENGYDRMTIGTWSANLYAMPLYKKVGYFWIPDTQVFMESFLPAIRRLDVAQAYFQQHDWYRTYRRALEQTEDDERHPATGNMKVYVCRWEEDGDSLGVVIDRQAQAVTGLATADFAAYAVAGEIEPALGFTYPMRWRITNHKDEPISVTVLAQGDAGIELAHNASLTLEPGEERFIEAMYSCPVDGPPLDPDVHKPAPRIRSTLVIGDQVIELATGLRYRPAVEFSTEPGYPSLLPGREQLVNLRLHNQAKQALSGSVMITPQDGMTTDWQRRDIQIEADGYLGLPVRVICDRSGPIPLLVSATFDVARETVTTSPQPLLLLSTGVGGVTTGSTADYGASGGKEVIIAENDFFQAIGRPSGGRCFIVSKALRRTEARIMAEAGPPFEPWDLSDKSHKLSVRQANGKTTLIFTAPSGNFPGVIVTREVTISSSPIIEVIHRVINNGSESHKFWIKPSLKLSDRESAIVALPHKDRLIVAHGADYSATHGDFPKKPDGLAEEWVALSEDGQVAGAIWPAGIVEHENYYWGGLQLHYGERKVQPQSSHVFGPFYLYVGPGGWREVRQTWQRLAGVHELSRSAPIRPQRPHTIGLSPATLVTLSNTVDAQVRVDSTRERPLNGELAVFAPEGWHSSVNKLSAEGVHSGQPVEASIRLTGNGNEPNAVTGSVSLTGEIEDESRPFTIIKLGDSSSTVAVTERQEVNQPLWEIDNGRSLWTIAPDYQAGVIAWRDGDRQVNHLLTTFPSKGELGWMSPLLGGIRPSIMEDPDGEGFPGKLHDERFTASGVEEKDRRGITWHGVELSATLTKEKIRGLRVDLAYLTVGGSNVLKVRYRIHNGADAFRRAEPRLLAFANIDGRHDNATVYGEALQRKRTAHISWPKAGTWGVVENPESGRAMALVAGSGHRDVSIMDWGVDGGHLLLGEHPLLAPGSNHEIVAYLVLADSVDEAKQYQALAGMG